MSPLDTDTANESKQSPIAIRKIVINSSRVILMDYQKITSCKITLLFNMNYQKGYPVYEKLAANPHNIDIGKVKNTANELLCFYN